MNNTVAFPDKYFGQKNSWDTVNRKDYERSAQNFRRFFVDFIKNLPNKARVLDAGCGNGKAIRIMLAYRPDLDIHAIDISDVKSFLPPSVKFSTASVEEVSSVYPENSFDAIVCLHVIEHLLYPMTMVMEFKRVLKPGGRLYLETPNWSRGFIPFLSTYFWNDYTHIRIFTKQTIRKLFGDFNFKISVLSSVSSTSLITKNVNPVIEIKNNYSKHRLVKAGFFSRLLSVAGRVAFRVVSSILCDIIVVVATNEK